MNKITNYYFNDKLVLLYIFRYYYITSYTNIYVGDYIIVNFNDGRKVLAISQFSFHGNRQIPCYGIFDFFCRINILPLKICIDTFIFNLLLLFSVTVKPPILWSDWMIMINII